MSLNEFAIFNHDLRIRRRQQTRIPGGRVLRTLAHAVRDHFRRRDDYRTLLAMPDYLLEDVGLDRAQVVAALRRTPF